MGGRSSRATTTETAAPKAAHGRMTPDIHEQRLHAPRPTPHANANAHANANEKTLMLGPRRTARSGPVRGASWRASPFSISLELLVWNPAAVCGASVGVRVRVRVGRRTWDVEREEPLVGGGTLPVLRWLLHWAFRLWLCSVHLQGIGPHGLQAACFLFLPKRHRRSALFSPRHPPRTRP